MAASLSRVERALVDIMRDLHAEAAPYALVGGLAVSARAEPRTTRDVDLAVSVPDDTAAEALILRLRARGLEVRSIVEHVSAKRLATARLTRVTAPTVYVDLLFASSGIEPEIVAAAERLEVVAGLTVPVATRAHLIALKLLARDDRHRPQDWDDLRALIADVEQDELGHVRAAAQLIAARGYARGRDLVRDLDELLSAAAPD